MRRSKVQGSFTDKTFKDCDVTLDGSSFERCRFDNCQLTYGGGVLPVVSGCAFDNCAWGFVDEAAHTIAFMSGFYNGGFDELIEATFHQIRKGAMIEQTESATGPADDKLHGARPIFGLPGPKIFRIPKRRQP